MPQYVYECEDGHRFEVVQRIVEEPLKECPTCKKATHRVIGNVGVVWKAQKPTPQFFRRK